MFSRLRISIPILGTDGGLYLCVLRPVQRRERGLEERRRPCGRAAPKTKRMEMYEPQIRYERWRPPCQTNPAQTDGQTFRECLCPEAHCATAPPNAGRRRA